MSKDDDRIRLRHMLDAAQKASSFIESRGRADLDADEMFALALIRLLEVLGEAAKGVSVTFRQRHSQIAWQQISGTRDRLIHGYMDVDLDVVWEILTSDLPPLIGELKKLVPQ